MRIPVQRSRSKLGISKHRADTQVLATQKCTSGGWDCGLRCRVEQDSRGTPHLAVQEGREGFGVAVQRPVDLRQGLTGGPTGCQCGRVMVLMSPKRQRVAAN